MTHGRGGNTRYGSSWRCIVLSAALVCIGYSGAIKADFLQALQAYEQENYAAAYTGFAELIVLGNAQAAFNLGVMYYHGRGVETNSVESVAYLHLARALGNDDAAAAQQHISEQLSDSERRLARLRYEELQQQVVIRDGAAATQLYDLVQLQPVQTPMPVFPDEVHRRSRFGYIVVRFLVDKDGSVPVVDVIDSYPSGNYERSTLRTLKRWKFEPTGQQHLLSTQLNFWVPGSLRAREVEHLLTRDNIWDYAALGGSGYQEYVGSILHLIHIASGKQTYVDESLPDEREAPDFTELLRPRTLTFRHRQFLGYTLVHVDEHGVIDAVLADHALEAPDTADLIGQRIRGANAGRYSISRPSRRDSILVQKLHPIPRQHTADFWWGEAAKNGNLKAQRILANQRIDWQFYLLQQQDLASMAWHGVRLTLDGEREQGLALLRQAAEQGYRVAEELLRVLTSDE